MTPQNTEILLALQTLFRQHERRMSWLILPPLFILAYLAGRYHHEHPRASPATASGAPATTPTVVTEPKVEAAPDDPKSWPWGIPPAKKHRPPEGPSRVID